MDSFATHTPPPSLLTAPRPHAPEERPRRLLPPLAPSAPLSATVRALDVLCARATTHRGSAPVDLALLAVAAADGWASGNGLPRPRAYLADRLLAACRRAGRRHHIYADGAYHSRAGRALGRMATLVNEAPAPVRAAVLCAVLLDLLNDRGEEAFAGVSEVLTRLDRECPRAPGHDVEALASVIAERVREEMGR